ncbi:hypothetical protein NPIL_318701 [Nephila pilipes]|uniref:Uncharacterized protein n=1 Tax=Nephila pilipes TaxID=299642 RepID=A0A8X6NJB7_NEPPI|nr:hypothetical protein NPIL_318701 [Nephila pilipes]
MTSNELNGNSITPTKVNRFGKGQWHYRTGPPPPLTALMTTTYLTGDVDIGRSISDTSIAGEPHQDIPSYDFD